MTDTELRVWILAVTIVIAVTYIMAFTGITELKGP